MKKYYLKSIYSSQKSFYKKAYIVENNAFISLFSYDSYILSINKYTSEIIYSNLWDYSQTTLKHLKEFIQQNKKYFENLKTYTKKDIKKFFEKYATTEEQDKMLNAYIMEE